MALSKIKFGRATSLSGGAYVLGSDVNPSSYDGVNGADANISSQSAVPLSQCLSDADIESGNLSPQTKLSPNYTINYFFSGACNGGKFGEGNTAVIPDATWKNVVKYMRNYAACILESLHSAGGEYSPAALRITNGYRSPSKTKSPSYLKTQHGHGQACDFQPPSAKNSKEMCIKAVGIIKIVPSFSQLIVEYGCSSPAGLIHLGYGNHNSVTTTSNQVLTTNGNGHGGKYANGVVTKEGQKLIACAAQAKS